MKARAVALGVILAALAAAPALAGPQEVAAAVAREIMSPFCPGVTLHDCPSAQADDMRRQIVDMADSGLTKDEIVSDLVAEYGESIRAAPRNPAASALPFLAAASGALIAWRLARRWSRARPAAPERADVTAAERARLEAELERYRSES